MLEGAATSKLGVECKQKDLEAKADMKCAAASGHEAADHLREEGLEELAEAVDEVVKEVEHALEGEMEVEEVEHAVVDAKAAAVALRVEGKEEDAAKMDAVVWVLEEGVGVGGLGVWEIAALVGA